MRAWVRVGDGRVGADGDSLSVAGEKGTARAHRLYSDFVLRFEFRIEPARGPDGQDGTADDIGNWES